MDIKRIIGENIKQIRHSKGYTLDDLAIISKISRTYINDVELGRYAITVVKLEVIAKALKVDLEALIKKDGYKEYLKKDK